MDTIISYLDNVFANLPKTSQMLQVKQDLLANMTEKYEELKDGGKTENEAVGQVISEFGNIDELLESLGINAQATTDLPVVNQTIASEFLTAKKHSGRLVGLGVFLCITGAAALILVNELIQKRFWRPLRTGGTELGLIPLLIMVACAVGLFIYSGIRLEKFKFLEQEFYMPDDVKAWLNSKKESDTPGFAILTIAGVMLCILSPIPLFLSSLLAPAYSSFGLVLLLVIVAIAVFCFIYAGSRQDAYKMLLQLEEYAPRKKNDKVIGVVASIIWPLAVVFYLLSGFLFGLWNITWIIFPITGILFGMFCAVYGAIKNK